MSWRAHFVALKASSKGAPKLNNGAKVAPGAVAYNPTTQLGLQDQVSDRVRDTSGVDTAQMAGEAGALINAGGTSKN